jgi:hypothetical protein
MLLIFKVVIHQYLFILGKEKILVCSECRTYFKCYGEFPCLDPPKPSMESPEPNSNEDEVDFDDDDELEEKPLQSKSSSLGGELNLTAIERDSDLAGDHPELDEPVKSFWILLKMKVNLNRRSSNYLALNG